LRRSAFGNGLSLPFPSVEGALLAPKYYLIGRKT
jgi:hypothetical protein